MFFLSKREAETSPPLAGGESLLVVVVPGPVPVDAPGPAAAAGSVGAVEGSLVGAVAVEVSAEGSAGAGAGAGRAMQPRAEVVRGGFKAPHYRCHNSVMPIQFNTILPLDRLVELPRDCPSRNRQLFRPCRPNFHHI